VAHNLWASRGSRPSLQILTDGLAPTGLHLAPPGATSFASKGVRRPALCRTGNALHFAMVGTRGVPASYGGFETAVEEISLRLVDRGHRVTVFCRGDRGQRTWRGIELIDVPALRDRRLETLSSSFASVPHIWRVQPDAAVLFNSANSPILPLLRVLGIPVAVHVDGLEWRRSKWGPVGRRYYQLAEQLAVRSRSPLIADASGIADYYMTRYRRSTELIAYGAPIRAAQPTDGALLRPHGVTVGEYHLAVSRMEPENHVREIVEGYLATDVPSPLVFVGDNPYDTEYTVDLKRLMQGSDRIIWLGSVWDQQVLDALYANCATYLHGHSVGGTNPSLLRAMGAGAPVIAWDVVFNREVAGSDAAYFHDPGSLGWCLIDAEKSQPRRSGMGDVLAKRVKELYDWDDVTDKYERLLCWLGEGRHGCCA
jgi:glycosyltransferase involved in cell wall biosynthesis